MARHKPRSDWKALQAVFEAVFSIGDGRKCYQLSDKTVAMLLSQVEYLNWPTRWKKETPFTDADKDLIGQWAARATAELMKEEDCVTCDDDDCIVYPLNGSMIEWLPANPFTEPDRVPEGYLLPPWYVAAEGSLIGASPGDVVSDVAHIPIGMALPPYDRITRFRLSVQGAVLVRIHFVNLFAGGVAQIQIDGELSSLSYFDLNADIVSVPPEPAGEVIWEHQFTVDAPHFIDVGLLPWFDDSLTIFRYGGGIRKIVICGENVCPDCEDCPECEDCEDCEDYIEDEFGIDEDELHMLLDCYKHDVGDIKMHAGNGAAGGWLLCDGAYYPKTLYPDLFAVLEGVTGETTDEFAVPNLADLSPMGVSIGLGLLQEAGAFSHTLTEGELPSHSHAIGGHVHEVGGHTHPSPVHAHTLSNNPHAHVSAQVVIPTKSGSEAGGGQRLVRANNSIGTDNTITVEPAATATSSSSISATSVEVQENTPFSTGSASGETDAAGGGDGHSILHPVFGVNYYIFAGCKGDC